jgi:1-acyl-sn-glycerol-3-phosphate acyltransferase
MNLIRSLLVFSWLVITLIPLGIGLVVCSVVLSSTTLWWWFAAPFLKGVIGAARIIAGVEYRVHGGDRLPSAEDMRRVILCPKHQSTWETFYFASMTSHPLAYVFKKELLNIPVFGWSIGRLDMIHIDRTKRSEAWKKVAEQGQRIMDDGKWVIMFPEGTRIDRGQKGGYKSGDLRSLLASSILFFSSRCYRRIDRRAHSCRGPRARRADGSDRAVDRIRNAQAGPGSLCVIH